MQKIYVIARKDKPGLYYHKNSTTATMDDMKTSNSCYWTDIKSKAKQLDYKKAEKELKKILEDSEFYDLPKSFEVASDMIGIEEVWLITQNDLQNYPESLQKMFKNFQMAVKLHG